MSSLTPWKTYRVSNDVSSQELGMLTTTSVLCSLLIRHFDFSEQLHNKMTEQQETAARFEELEQQLMSVSAKKSCPPVHMGINE